MAGTDSERALAGGGWRDGGVVGVVVHPRRRIDNALEQVRAWSEANGGTMRQVVIEGQERRVAETVAVEECDVVLAMGGDGTVLAALHAAAPVGRQVLGVACGSLGALTSVKAPDVGTALDRFAAGDWEARALPALEVSRDGAPIGRAFNDLVVIRRGAGQVILEIEVDGGTFARVAGDGVIVATPLGSSAYTLAAKGPLVAATAADVLVITSLSPHGGSVPSVVVGGTSTVTIRVDGGFSGARVELDGRATADEERSTPTTAFTLETVVKAGVALLVDLDGETLIAGLRRRGVIADSPRLRARDARTARRDERS